MDDFFSLTLSLYRPYIKRLSPILEDNNLNVARWLILKDIYYHQPTLLVNIAKRRFIEKSTTRQILKVFEEKNIITMEVNEKDKRYKFIHLTQEGLDLFRRVNQHILVMDQEFLDNISYDENEYDTAQCFIEKLLLNIKGVKD